MILPSAKRDGDDIWFFFQFNSISLNHLKNDNFRSMEKVRSYKWDSNVANRFKMAVIQEFKSIR